MMTVTVSFREQADVPEKWDDERAEAIRALQESLDRHQ